MPMKLLVLLFIQKIQRSVLLLIQHKTKIFNFQERLLMNKISSENRTRLNNFIKTVYPVVSVCRGLTLPTQSLFSPPNRPVDIFAFGEYYSKQVIVSGIRIFQAQLQSLKLRRAMLNAVWKYTHQMQIYIQFLKKSYFL